MMRLPDWTAQEPFRRLPMPVHRWLESVSEEKRLREGEVLFREGEPAGHLWIVRSGWVRLVRQVTDGQQLTVDIVTPKERFCGLTAFISGRYMSTAVAAGPVTVVAIPAKALSLLMQEHVELASYVAKQFDERYQHMVAVYTTAFCPVQQRLAAVLIRLKRAFGSVLPVTRREVAEMGGTTVETAIRVTRQMQKEGILQVSRGRIAILHPSLLAKP